MTRLGRCLWTTIIGVNAIPSPQVVSKLNAREEQIVALLSKAAPIERWPSNWIFSEKTIKNYMSLLMQKLMARNRVGLVMAARGMPLTDTSSRDVERIGC